MPQNTEQQTKSCVEAVSLNLPHTELKANQSGDSSSSQLPFWLLPWKSRLHAGGPVTVSQFGELWCNHGAVCLRASGSSQCGKLYFLSLFLAF